MSLQVSTTSNVSTNKANPETFLALTLLAFEYLLLGFKQNLILTNLALLIKKWPLYLVEGFWVLLVNLRLINVHLPRESVVETANGQTTS